MKTKKHNVERLINVFSEETEEYVQEIKLKEFDLKAFQKEFGILDAANPMYDCYQIKEKNINFIKKYLNESVVWDFKKYSYFIEANGT